MTPSKLWYAQKLATLQGDPTKAEELSEQMTIRRLCYEIEKLEEEEVPPPPPPKKLKCKSFWARVALETSSDDEE